MSERFFGNPFENSENINPQIYEDTLMQRIRTYNGEDVTETHCGANTKDLIEKNPFEGDTFKLERTLSLEDGTLKGWHLQVNPLLSEETKSNLDEIVRRNQQLNFMETRRTLYGNLPYYEIGDNKNLNIHISKNAKAIADDTKVDDLVERDYSYIVAELPSEYFLDIKDLEDVENFVPKLKFIMLKTKLSEIRERMSDCIQDGTFSENRLRSLMNITFDLKRKDDMEENIQ